MIYQEFKEELCITQGLLKDWEYISDVIFRYPAFENLTLKEAMDWFSNKYAEHENNIRKQFINK